MFLADKAATSINVATIIKDSLYLLTAQLAYLKLFWITDKCTLFLDVISWQPWTYWWDSLNECPFKTLSSVASTRIATLKAFEFLLFTPGFYKAGKKLRVSEYENEKRVLNLYKHIVSTTMGNLHFEIAFLATFSAKLLGWKFSSIEISTQPSLCTVLQECVVFVRISSEPNSKSKHLKLERLTRLSSIGTPETTLIGVGSTKASSKLL